MAPCFHGDAAPLPLPPLVLVEGFLCAASSSIWGSFQDELDVGEQDWLSANKNASSSSSLRRQTIFAAIGPVSSLHDRACELFYSLHGGRVDYGEAHAREHGHGRFGRDFGRGKYPQWGERDPTTGAIHAAHFIGHSLGGPTIYKMQQLLRRGFFDCALRKAGAEDEAVARSRANAMILSILAVSSPFRGTPIVHLLGEEPLAHPVVRRFSAGDLIAKTAHLVTFLHQQWLPKSLKARLPDLHADSWPFANKADGGGRSPLHVIFDTCTTLARQWRKSDWAEGRDCAPWDCTVYERLRMEDCDEDWGIAAGDAGDTGDRTWYCSIAAYTTTEEGTSRSRQAPFFLHGSLVPSLLTFSANWLAKFDYGKIPNTRDEGAQSAQAGPLRTTSVGSAHVPPRHGSDSGCMSSSAVSTMPSSGSATPIAKATQRGDIDSRKNFGASEASTSEVLAGATATLSGHDNGEQHHSFSHAGWSANDGVVPLASQYHPRDCAAGGRNCTHSMGLPGHEISTAEASRAEKFVAWLCGRTVPPKPLDLPSHHHSKPNHYYTYTVSNTTHATLCPLWIGSAEQRAFWRFVGGWLRDVEAAAAARGIGADRK